jgi:hypothetical protein
MSAWPNPLLSEAWRLVYGGDTVRHTAGIRAVGDWIDRHGAGILCNSPHLRDKAVPIIFGAGVRAKVRAEVRFRL